MNFIWKKGARDKDMNEQQLKRELSINKKLLYFEILKKIEEHKKTNIGELNISYLDIIGVIFCRCCKQYKTKNDLIEYSIEEMKKYMDYLDIIKLLQEFTKLKLILLNERQLQLFSFISKPEIIYKDKEMKNSYLHGKIFERKNISLQNLYEIYVETNEKNNNFIDKRIIEFIDSELKDTFENVFKKAHLVYEKDSNYEESN